MYLNLDTEGNLHSIFIINIYEVKVKKKGSYKTEEI